MATRSLTLRDALNSGNEAFFAAAAKRIKLGNMLSLIKVVATALTGAASFDITLAAFKAKSVITGITLDTEEQLSAIGKILSCRVTAAGTASHVGSVAVTDTDGTVLTPATSSVVGLAKISTDGKTLTFSVADVTAFTLEYYPRAAEALTAEYQKGM